MHASSPTRPALLALLLPLLSLTVSCGGPTTAAAPTTPIPGGSPCEQAELRLRKQLGPEFQAVAARVPLFKPPVGEVPAQPLGCAIAYTLVPEELSEEGTGDEVGSAAMNQQLAFITSDGKRSWTLSLIDPSASAPGAVVLEFETKDLDGDGTPEVIVRESGAGTEAYQGLRIFSLTAAGDGGPRDLLTESLKVVTAENLQLFGAWRTETAGGSRQVIFEAGGTSRIFTWNDGEKRYQFNEAATTAAKRSSRR